MSLKVNLNIPKMGINIPNMGMKAKVIPNVVLDTSIPVHVADNEHKVFVLNRTEVVQSFVLGRNTSTVILVEVLAGDMEESGGEGRRP